MSNNEYTRTREQVVSALVDTIAGGTITVPGGYGELQRDDAENIVDALLPALADRAEVERAASEKAYDEGVSDFMQAHDSDNFEPWMHLRDNPYRQKDS